MASVDAVADLLPHVVDKTDILPVLDTEMEDIVAQNQLPLGEEEEERRSHREDNEVVVEEDDDVVPSSSSSFALDYEKIVDLERPWVILSYLPAGLQKIYSSSSGYCAH